MKPQEGELVTEISKLQGMVLELKAGFSSALLELSQIQHGDMDLREELGDNRRRCEKKALHLEALVQSLRDELGEMRCQILQQICSNRQRPQQDLKETQSAGDRLPASVPPPRESDSGPANGRSCCGCMASSPSTSPRGRVLLHCYLQGLKAGLCEETDERHQRTRQLLHSEWEYVSILNQLYDKYKTPTFQMNFNEPYQTFLTFVERLLQRHLLFRNTLEERLSAEHWKCLVGDIFVQLIGHNDSSFSDMYHGYTTTLTTLLSLEFNRIQLSEKMHNMQNFQVEKEELKLLSLLLAPVSRINSYLTHIQNLLQWTTREHPDCSLLQGSERVLRNILSRCHVILEEDVRWGDGGAAGTTGSCSACVRPAACCSRSQLCRASGTYTSSQPPREEAHAAAQRGEQQHVNLSNGASGGGHAVHFGCGPHGSVRRKSCMRSRTLPSRPRLLHDCSFIYNGNTGCLLNPASAAQGWGEMTSDSGQGTSSQAVGKRAHGYQTPHMPRSLEDGETDPEDLGDTSVFDYSSVTTCSPDETLQTGLEGSNSGEEEEETEEDSQVPVLLKPSYTQPQLSDLPRERTVCLRWQIPRIAPRPPPRDSSAQCMAGQTPGPVGPYGQRVVSIRQGSPPLLPNSAFRPIWDEPLKQGDAAMKENVQGFIPIQATERQVFPNFNQSRENPRSVKVSSFPAQQRDGQAGAMGGARVWDESEDSEGPCSTV